MTPTMKIQSHSLSKIPHAYDMFFKTAMKDKRVAQEFFTAHLPQDFLSLIDLTQLELKSESYIDDLRKESITDLLFKTGMHGSDAYLYLIVDHQSRPDKLMPFRILKYTCNIIDQHLKETRSQRIPFVLPFVLYHGKQIWKHSTDIRDLVDAPKALVEDYFLKPFFLIDLNKIDDSTLKERVWLGVMELTLKHIFDRNIEPAIKDIIDLLKVVLTSGEQQFTEATLSYILDRGQIENKELFIEKVKAALPEEIGEKMATIAEKYWIEGVAEGVEKEKVEIAKRLLRENTEPAFIARITGLSPTQIQEIKEKEVR